MAIRRQEIHPTLVHFPLALHPLAVVTDSLGYLSGNRRLKKSGRAAAILAAEGSGAAGGAGQWAEREVEGDELVIDLHLRERHHHETRAGTERVPVDLHRHASFFVPR